MSAQSSPKSGLRQSIPDLVIFTAAMLQVQLEAERKVLESRKRLREQMENWTRVAEAASPIPLAAGGDAQ